MCVQAAVSRFKLLFSDGKARGNKERWKEYFLSETFLDVQFLEDFTNKMQDAVKLFLSENAFLVDNSVTLVYGNQDSCYFEKPIDTGIFGADEIADDEYEVTRKEKTYKTYWMFQDWNLQKTILYVGESGTIWYYKSLSKLAKAQSPAEVIAECYRLDDVTEVYINY